MNLLRGTSRCCCSGVGRRTTDTGHLNVQTIASRRYLHLPNPFRRSYNFRPLDQVPSNYELVYRNTMNTYVVYMYAPCVGTALTSIGAVAMTLTDGFTGMTVSQSPMLFDSHWQMAVVVPFILGLAFVTRMIAERCILRMYLDDERRKFVAVFGTLLPWRVRKLEFDAGQMRSLYDLETDEPASLFGAPIRAFRGEYALGRQRLIIFPEHFKRPYHYNVMMGFTN